MATATENQGGVSTGNSSSRNSQFIKINLLEDLYIDPEINNRQILDKPEEKHELAMSIQSTGGCLQPPVVYNTPESRLGEHNNCPYELGEGYRRVDALKYLAEVTGDMTWATEVDVKLNLDRSLADREVEQLTENLMRRNYDPMELAIAFKKVLDNPECNMTTAELARRLRYDAGTMSSAVKVASTLLPEVIGEVLEGKIKWSSAKALAYAVDKHQIPEQQQKVLAALATTKEVAEFADHLKKTYSDAPASEDEAKSETVKQAEAEGTVPEKPASQHVHTAIRTQLLRDKYLKKLMELKNEAKKAADKAKEEIRIDTIRWMLKEQGTQLGAELSSWEEELVEQAKKKEAMSAQLSLKETYVRQAIKGIKEKLAEVPPATLPDGSANSNRTMATLGDAIKGVQLGIMNSLKAANVAGLPANMMNEGFPVENVELFVTEINNAYTEHEKALKAAVEKRKLAKEAKEAADKAKADEAEAAAASQTDPAEVVENADVAASASA